MNVALHQPLDLKCYLCNKTWRDDSLGHGADFLTQALCSSLAPVAFSPGAVQEAQALNSDLFNLSN